MKAAWLVALLPAASFAQNPTFAHDIAPIIYEHCASCHRPGEAAPFPLLTFDDVRKRGKQIVKVVETHYMPPWLPEPGYGEFAGANRLTDAQIHLIADWVESGAPMGPLAELPAPPRFTSGWQLGPPDLIVEAKQAFALPASGSDVYWNFIFAPAVEKLRNVRAVEVRPGDKRLVHHAVMVVDRSHWGRAQEATPGAGFPGMELTNRRSVFDPDDGHFLFWKPGGAPYVEPDGLAWQLMPGDDLVLNAHLRPSGKPEQVRPTIGLYFTAKPPDKFPMLVQLEHDGALNIPAGARDFVVSDDFKLPLDADVLAVYPHAHYLGRLLEGYATLPDGQRKALIRVPQWDQSWQTVYRYREPVFLPKGTVISMRFHYDNSAANVRNPNQPPKRVQAGNRATDEMGHLWLQVLPRGAGDHRLELNEALIKHRLEKYPEDFRAHMILGALLLARLDAPAAVPMAEAAVRIQPQDAEAHNLLGSALQGVGRWPEALEHYRQAVALRPEFVKARFNLANALARSARWPEAIGEYNRVLAAFPNDELAKQRFAQALVDYGDRLVKDGQRSQAAGEYAKALALDPKNHAARARLQNR